MTHKFAIMLGFIAYRSLKEAAAKHADAIALAAGDETSQLQSEQMIMDNADDRQIQYSYTTPQEPDSSPFDTPSSDDHFGEVAESGELQLPIEVAKTAADLIETAGFDALVAYRNIDSFAPAVSGRGEGFRGPHLMDLAPR